MDTTKSNYGYTPFDKFEIGKFKAGKTIFYVCVLGLLTFLMSCHHILKENIFHKNTFFQKYKFIEYIIYFSPLLLIIYFDTKYNTFSIKNVVSNLFPFVKQENIEQVNPHINYILRLIGAYGIIQVLAQDFGIKTGKKQSDLTKPEFVQWIIFTGTAYSLVHNRSEAMIAATAYFILKFIISNGETKPVCFDDV